MTYANDCRSQQSTAASMESRALIRKKANEVVYLLLDHRLLALQRRWIGLSRVGAFRFYRLQEKVMEQRAKDAVTLRQRGFNPQSPNQIPSFKNLHEASRPPVWIPAPPKLTHGTASRRSFALTDGASVLSSMLLDLETTYDESDSAARAPSAVPEPAFVDFFGEDSATKEKEAPTASDGSSFEPFGAADIATDEAFAAQPFPTCNGAFGDAFAGSDPFSSTATDFPPPSATAADPFFGDTAWPATEAPDRGAVRGTQGHSSSAWPEFETAAPSANSGFDPFSSSFGVDPFEGSAGSTSGGLTTPDAFGFSAPLPSAQPQGQRSGGHQGFSDDPFGASPSMDLLSLSMPTSTTSYSNTFAPQHSGQGSNLGGGASNDPFAMLSSEIGRQPLASLGQYSQQQHRPAPNAGHEGMWTTPPRGNPSVRGGIRSEPDTRSAQSIDPFANILDSGGGWGKKG